MSIPIFIIDAFAIKPFTGNPAAICLLESMDQIADDRMQCLAVEMNLSETAFVDLSNRQIRWFTPAQEVDLCGHATLASAKAMFDCGIVSPGDEVVFESRSGKLSVQVKSDHDFELNFPATPPEELDIDAVDLSCFELPDPASIRFAGQSRFDLMVELENQKLIESLTPDFRKMKELDFRGVMVTAKSDDDQFDFVSRFFAPACNIDEDPATGSAHCCLAPYWQKKLNQTKMRALQMSARTGQLDLETVDDRVKLGGKAFTMVKGELVDANI